jgi:hypothetical protein
MKKGERKRKGKNNERGERKGGIVEDAALTLEEFGGKKHTTTYTS